MCVHVFLKIIEMNKSRRVYNSQFTIHNCHFFPSILLSYYLEVAFVNTLENI